MKVPAIGTLSATGFLIFWQLTLAVQSDPTRDDALVLAAVIEHTILPAVRNASSSVSRAAVAVVNGRSIPLCKERPTNQMTCAIPESWQKFLGPMRRAAGLVWFLTPLKGSNWWITREQEHRAASSAGDQQS